MSAEHRSLPGRGPASPCGHDQERETAHRAKSAASFKRVIEGRTARPVEELDEDTLRAIARSAVSSEHATLADLVEDWTP